MRLACQLRAEGQVTIEVARPAPPSRWKSIPVEELPPLLGVQTDVENHNLGVAVDLGTTHIRVSLWDRQRGLRIASRWGRNPQAVHGADVLNRLSQAQTRPQRGKELAELARGAILQAIRDMLAREMGEIDTLLPEIGRLLVVGNTAMLALLTEAGRTALLDPDCWQRPIDCNPPDRAGWRQAWHLPNADLLFPASLAGFVGSDLLASVLGTRLLEGPPGSMLLDVGTNTELALWDGRILHVTSVPGGPAFEGAGSRFGMAAEPGAIARIKARPGGDGFMCETVGGAAARGFCGSGLIDAVAVLFESGILKPSGRFALPVGTEGYTLDPASPRSAISSADVDAVQRAKAATASAMAELMDLAGLDWQDLGRLCVCGAFGRGLDLGHAQVLGLLPPVGPERIELHPNAALAGCECALLAQAPEALFSEIARRARPINLSFRPGWEDRFINHLRLGAIPIGADYRSPA
jgi:uncharacterized 2Fe-2S/4Fe-4S cluster protein (DUF4445 family)